jgi:acyl-CoA synthetase (AMP-forming)/AMP-acid ligase II
MIIPRDVSQVFAEPLASKPDGEAMVTRSGSYTYRELNEAANRAARALLEVGVRAGDRVAACLPNDLEIVAAFHGAMRIGAIWVGVGGALAPPEKSYIIRDSGARLLLCASAVAAELATHREGTPRLSAIAITDTASGVDQYLQWNEIVSGQAPGPLDTKIDAKAPAAIAYTSGTTGLPKGAVHSQRNLLIPGAYLIATRGYGADLRKGDCFPLTSLNMHVLSTLLVAQAGGCTVLMDTLRSDDIVEWIRRERVTVWNGPPPVLYTLAHDPRVRAADLESLEEVWSGGAECPESVRSAFESKFGTRIFSTYGLTEAPTVVAIEPRESAHVPGATGMPLPHLAVSIRDADCQLVSNGEVGEICVAPSAPGEIATSLTTVWNLPDLAPGPDAAYSPMLGYWERPEQSELVMRGGVLHTGDAGWFDEEGNLKMSDRLSLVINRGGANVYPAEVERVVLGSPGVEACVVFGVPDERLGQRVALLVQFATDAGPSVDALLAHCRSELAAYKVPELAAPVNEFPRNAMGKIDRRAVSATPPDQLSRVRPSIVGN